MRIVSLVPSLTELVWALGRGESLVGRTTFCTEPPEIKRVPAVGGTKNPKIERIASLHPDLVIANREENRKEDVEALRARGLHVLVTDPNSVAEAVATIRELGRCIDAATEADKLRASIEGAAAASPAGPRRRVAVIVWKEPLMVLGSATYGNDLLELCGGENVFGGLERYPVSSLDELAARAPSLVLLPDEPYPFKAKDVGVFAAIAPTQIVDGKLLWWYGPRMPAAIASLRSLLLGPSPDEASF